MRYKTKTPLLVAAIKGETHSQQIDCNGSSGLCQSIFYSKYIPILFKNPIFMMLDKASLQFIRRFKTSSIQWINFRNSHHLTFCYKQEVWLLYAHKDTFILGMKLGRHLQQRGASKIKIIKIHSSWIGGIL